MKKRESRTYRIKEQPPRIRNENTERPPISEAKPRKNIRIHLKKRSIAFIAAALVLTMSIPLIFATAANTNEVAKIEELNMQSASAPAASPVTSPLPATTDGELASVLAEDAAAPTVDPSALPSTEPSATPSEPLQTAYQVLSSGMNDPFVAIIQQRLMDLNYMDQDDPTTQYGPVTKQAILYFQRKNNLPQDGVAGIETQTVLFSTSAKPYTVSEGDSGPDVQTIQDRLVELGYSVDDTGYFGTDTTKAVKYFQRMNSLTDDGNVGSNTMEVLYTKGAEPSKEYTDAQKAAAASSKPESSPESSSKPSSSGNPPASSPPASSPPASSTPAPPANTSKVEAFVNAGLAEVEKAYVLGGKGPSVFDCSGLVYYALKASGNGIPYMTSGGWANAGQYTRIDSMKDLQRGDVVCESGHVGIYLGDGQIVNASSGNGKVIVSTNVFSSSYWVNNFICGRRPL